MTDQFALVTGSSSGLGLAICEYLLDEGHTVFGVSRSGSPIEHGRFMDIISDVRDEASVEEMYSLVNNSTEYLNVIVNAAGVFEMSPLVETSTKEFSDHLKTNVLGPFHILKHCADFLVEGQTHIINISSIASQKGFPQFSAYCSSKFALNGLIESCREEWKNMGVRFSTLMPGAIDTPLWNSIGGQFERKKMLSIDDFMFIFDMVIRSPSYIQFPEINFLHKDGPI